MRLIVVVMVGFARAAWGQAEDLADVKWERVELAEKQVYFLIGDNGKSAREKGKGLLVVLPGGDGGEAFRPFVMRMWKHALPADVVVAQLVAVASDDKEQVVWPTASAKHAKQDFTTESFVAAVVADVGKRVTIDRDRVMALGWSSSGPALYAVAGAKEGAIKKFFIAMSAYRPRVDAVSTEAAKGKRFYLLHSPDDRVCPYRLAKAAKQALERQGAGVTLVDYAGGHGWHGDIFGMIRDGVAWLADGGQR